MKQSVAETIPSAFTVKIQFNKLNNGILFILVWIHGVKYCCFTQGISFHLNRWQLEIQSLPLNSSMIASTGSRDDIRAFVTDEAAA